MLTSTTLGAVRPLLAIFTLQSLVECCDETENSPGVSGPVFSWR